jgi:hypothetical protein
MWAAVAGVVRPAKVSDQVDVDVDWSNVNVMLPVPRLAFGGTSLVPARVAVQVISPPVAYAGRTPTEKAQRTAASPTTPRALAQPFGEERMLQ